MGHYNTIADYQDVDNYLEVSNNLESSRITDNINDTQDISVLTIEAQALQEWAPRTQGPQTLTTTMCTHSTKVISGFLLLLILAFGE